MILIKMNRLFYLFGILLFFSLPFLILILNGDQTHVGQQEIGVPSYLIPVMLIIEMLIYFIFGLLAGTSLSLPQMIQYSIYVALFRFIICLLGAFLFSISQEISYITTMQILWAGNPLLVLLQVFLLMMFGPHLVSLISPGIFGEKEHNLLREEDRTGEGKRPVLFRPEATPAGGFIRVYSFSELGRLLSNVIGIEGYILYTREGLILWQDCQLRLDAEKLVAAFIKEWHCHRVNDLAVGFDEPLRIITQTSEHSFIHVIFTRDFSGILIFRPDAHMSEILSRLKCLERTVKEFLETRYSTVGWKGGD